MSKPNPQDIDEKVKKQNDEFYGEETVGGTEEGLERDDDTEEALEKVIGNKPQGTLAEEIDKDEMAIAKGLKGKQQEKKKKQKEPELQ